MPKPFRSFRGTSIIRNVLVAALGAISVTPASAAEVAVYTIQSIPVSSTIGTTVVLIDAAETIEKRLSASLSDSPAQAVDAARQRLLEGGERLRRDLAVAYEGVAEAWSLGITTLPAVVVDRRYVVYGETSVERALESVEAFTRTQP